MADAAAFFQDYLWESDTTDKARASLAERGLKEKVLKDFGVGYAPVGPEVMMAHMEGLGYTRDEMAAVGLASVSARGRIHTQFRSRIMFPVRDEDGRVHGFAGYSTHLGPSWPMWIVTTDNAHYSRTEAVFGMDRAIKKIRSSRTAALKRDCLEVLLAHQGGETNAVTVHSSTVTRRQMLAMSEGMKGGIDALELDLPRGMRADDKHKDVEEVQPEQGPVRNLTQEIPDVPHIKAKRVALVSATALAAMNTWTGAPLAALWVGSHAQGGKVLSLTGVVIVLGVLLILELLLAWALTWLSAKYDELTGRPHLAGQTSPWHRAKRGERVQDIRHRFGVSAPEKVVAACVVLGVLAFELWFFLYAGAPFAN
jgi:hypothetical protein